MTARTGQTTGRSSSRLAPVPVSFRLQQLRQESRPGRDLHDGASVDPSLVALDEAQVYSGRFTGRPAREAFGSGTPPARTARSHGPPAAGWQSESARASPALSTSRVPVATPVPRLPLGNGGARMAPMYLRPAMSGIPSHARVGPPHTASLPALAYAPAGQNGAPWSGRHHSAADYDARAAASVIDISTARQASGGQWVTAMPSPGVSGGPRWG